MEDLENLINRACSGDVSGYAAIVRRFQDMAVGYSYSLVGDFHLAQDAAQEAFLEAYLSLSRLREPAAFPSWFRKILFKQCDRLTRGKRIATVSLEEAAGVASRAADPAEIAQQQETRSQVRAAIRSLPEKERAVTTLFYIGQYSHKEIGAFLGVPVTTVKNRLHSARNRLRERMLTMVQDDLHGQRPSRDERFAATVIEMLRSAAAGDRTRVEALLDQDARLAGPHDDPEHGHPDITPLHYAAEMGHIDVATALLDRGADVNALEPSHGLTPLGWAAIFRNQKKAMAEFLIARGAAIDLFSAASLGLTEAVAAILHKDPSLVHKRLTRNDWEMQPLHIAAWRGHLNVVELLLTHGAEPSARDTAGKTPAARAEEAGHADLAALLRQREGAVK